MEERRAKPRQRVLKAGTIEFDGSSVDCTIRNMSPIGGARRSEPNWNSARNHTEHREPS
jgi:hypothetical protein